MDDKQKLLNITNKTPVLKLVKINPTLDTLRVADFYYRLESCLKSDEYTDNIKMGPLSFCLDPCENGSGDNFLESKQLGSYLKSGASRRNNVIFVDYDGNRIEHEDIILNNPADVAEYFEESEVTTFFIAGNRLEILYKRQFVDCIPDINTHKRGVIISDETFPASKYRTVITQHHNSRIYKKNVLVYWKNKQERILVPSPEKTFANDLAYFMNQYIGDGHVDGECQNNWTDNRTDIRILTDLERDIYIIEVKWLGTSISYGNNKTTYDEERAYSGLVQINEYLKDEPNSICAALVLYDGRAEDNDIEWDNEFFEDSRHDSPMRFFLISESASNKGKRIAKKYVKKKKAKNQKL